MGQLLYTEAIASVGPGSLTPGRNTLWLADTAAPFVRTPLAVLPLLFGDVSIAWLSELTWIGPASFLALGQDLSLEFNCPKGCVPYDTIFVANPGLVLRGTITAGHATFEPVLGTTGATSYSLGEGGASIVFTRLHDLALYRVSISGGSASVVARVPVSGSGANIAELIGVSCKGTQCIVAEDPVWLFDSPFDIALPDHPRGVQPGAKQLFTASITSGTVFVLRTFNDLVATPIVSPVSGDVVAQVGGSLGHIQTVGQNSSRLHLFPSLLP